LRRWCNRCNRCNRCGSRLVSLRWSRCRRRPCRRRYRCRLYRSRLRGSACTFTRHDRRR